MHPFPFLLAPLSEGNTTNYPVHPAFLKHALFCIPGLNIDMVPHEMNEKSWITWASNLNYLSDHNRKKLSFLQWPYIGISQEGSQID